MMQMLSRGVFCLDCKYSNFDVPSGETYCLYLQEFIPYDTVNDPDFYCKKFKRHKKLMEKCCHNCSHLSSDFICNASLEKEMRIDAFCLTVCPMFVELQHIIKRYNRRPKDEQ